MKIAYCCRVCLCLGLLLMVGCSGAREGKMEQNVLRFKTLIDGSDTVKVKGDALWYEHHNYDLPGKWRMEFDEPTFINDQAWKPEWVGGISRPFSNLQPALPHNALDQINLTIIRGRGKVLITEKPNQENDYTLSIYFDDDLIDGADWYEIKVVW